MFIEPSMKWIENDFHAYSFDLFQISVIAFRDNFEVIYDPTQSQSVQQIIGHFKYRCLVNGSFFEWSGQHAGWLSVLGNHFTPLKQDRQLTHVAILNSLTSEVTFLEAESWEPSLSSETNIEFQTGPLVLQANQLDEASIQCSINGLRSHRRTLLAFTHEDGLKYFITVREPERLDILGRHLLKLSIFEAKKLSVINLDGGPSVALTSRITPKLNYNEDAILPILLALK